MIEGLLARLKHAHPFLKSVDSHAELKEGFSSDRKFILYADDGPRWLLRLSAIEQVERRRREFDLLAVHYGNGTRCPEPHIFGTTEDRTQCYSLIGYIRGEAAERALPALSTQQQYQVGYQAGSELWKLHQLAGSETQVAWLNRRGEKYRRRKKEAADLKLGFFEQERIERFVEARMSVLEVSPVRFQHDDYHVGNLIIREGDFVGVIDFNRSDWGDPVEDFYKVPWFSEPVSQPFSRGQIDGYLARENPQDFWIRYNLFVAMNFHGSLVYEYEYGQEAVSQWKTRIESIVQTHDFTECGPPSWHKES